jgi:hypothetical protein
VKGLALVSGVVMLAGVVRAVDRDVTLQDIERALAVARSREAERAAFHAPYIQKLNTPFVESAELVTEYRRVVLLAEDRAQKGDRMFGYSASLAQKAVAPWHDRVAVVVRLRFHPQNTYVMVPNIDIDLPVRSQARIGVRTEPVLGFGTTAGERLPVLGALAEGVFDVTALEDTRYEFVIRVDKKEVGRVTFDLAALP